jgi:hypothetical protein
MIRIFDFYVDQPHGQKALHTTEDQHVPGYNLEAMCCQIYEIGTWQVGGCLLYGH